MSENWWFSIDGFSVKVTLAENNDIFLISIRDKSREYGCELARASFTKVIVDSRVKKKVGVSLWGGLSYW